MTTKAKEVQQTRRFEYKDFKLKKFKVTKVGVDVSFEENSTDPGTNNKEGKYLPHPDLKIAMNKLQLYMATRLGLLMGWDYAREHLKGIDDVKEGAMNGHKQAVEMCNVNGLTFLGEGETYGVSITGSVKCPISGSTGLAVPKITFGKTDLGYEDEVEELCEEIKKEIYAYRFQQKKYQTDVVSEAEKVENPELFGEPKSKEKPKKN